MKLWKRIVLVAVTVIAPVALLLTGCGNPCDNGCNRHPSNPYNECHCHGNCNTSGCKCHGAH